MTVEEKLEIQVKIARNCKTQCKDIKNKLGTLNNLMKELDHSFKNGQEKYYIYSRLNTCGSNIAKVGNTYDAFADNVLQLSEQMKKFLTFSGIMDGKNPIKYNPVDCIKSSSTKAVINTTSTRVCANKIVALGSNLYDINLNLGAAIKNVDETLMKAITRKYGSIAKLNKQLDQYSNAIKAVGQDLLVICDNYEKAEKNLQKRLREITDSNGKGLTYGCGSVTEDTKKIYGFTERVVSFGLASYSITHERGGLAGTNIIGNKQVLDWIQKRNDNLPNKTAYSNGLCTLYTLDKLRKNGIKVSPETQNGGNGNKWYYNIKSGKTKTPSGYSVECVDGDDALKEVISMGRYILVIITIIKQTV